MKRKILLILVSTFLLCIVSLNKGVEKTQAYELPTVTISCDTGGSGDCYSLRAETHWPSTYITFSYVYTGMQRDYCNGFLTLLINILQ